LSIAPNICINLSQLCKLL